MYRNDTITAPQIEDALFEKHAKDMCFRELRFSSGFAVPDWAGLMEVEWHCHKFAGAKPFLRIKKTIPAPKRDKDAPSWGLVVSMVWNATKHLT